MFSLRNGSAIPAIRALRRRPRPRRRSVRLGGVGALVNLMFIPGASVEDCSAHSQCGIDRLSQGPVAEWFEQALHGALLERAGAYDLICVRGDEDDRDLLPATGQFPLEV